MAELIDITIPGQKKSYPLKDVTIIGRASTTDIKLDDLLVSRHHARICKSAGGYLIEDLGSQNGVFLGSERITSPRPLTSGEKICIGPYTLAFKDAESGQPSPSEFPSTEYTQIIMATKDPLPIETMGETTGRKTADKGEFETFQKRLKIFHDITRVIGNIFDLDALLKEIIQIVFAAFPHAGRCFVALQDSDESQLTIRTIQAKDHALAEEGNVMSQTLAQRAIKERKSLLIMDTQMDSRVSTSIKIIGARSIMCAPLISPQKTLGILQIESKSRNYEFSKADLDLFTGIASQVALLIYSAELFDDLKRANERIASENKNLKKQQKVQSSFSHIIGTSPKIKEILELVKKISNAPYSVLITGKSGSGKELIAKSIHYNSSRSGQPFVALNCAAIPRDLLESELFGYEKGAFTGAAGTKQGLFEVADKGTIFLDEIGDMHPHTQAKLLRVLQEKELQRIGGTKVIKIDVRVLAATNKDLKTAMNSGEFREDLFYRLNVVPIHLPPLCERREDIPLLIAHFLELSCADVGKRVKGFTPEALTLLLNYSWPGNVRELRNVVERIVTIAPDDVMFGVEMLPQEISNKSTVQLQKYKSTGTLYEAQKQLEIEMIMDALKSADGNKSKAAEILGISRKVLYEKIEAYKIS
ncbi:MAG TPA: sigma 54-interacting transcriptional regulator [Candidatus Wunengus sp. YC60]|uniref:sigma 54-interacting transcriptional regulator n=1 Tax=Candidatus Wunengus sp. YC60 TaxID=3367697 RepID=UPI004027C3E3